MNPDVLLGARQGARRGRRAQRARLPHPPLRGERRATPTARSSSARRSSTRRSRTQTNILRRALEVQAASSPRVKVDRTQPKPKVSIIGEFWAMTTEGDGNYQLQRFLESEGAEVRHPARHRVAPLHALGGRARHAASARICAAPTRRKYGLGGIGPVRRRARSSAASRRPSRSSAASSRPSRTRWASTATTCPTWTSIAEISARVLQQRSPRRRRPHGGRQAHHERRPLEGAHDAEREAVRLHAERGRVRRRAVGHHREVPRHHLLPGRDERRRARELLLARADVPLQGQAGRRWPSSSARARSTA